MYQFKISLCKAPYHTANFLVILWCLSRRMLRKGNIILLIQEDNKMLHLGCMNKVFLPFQYKDHNDNNSA